MKRLDIMQKLNAERFAHLEALILAKSFTAPSVLVSKKSTVPVSDKPFFVPSSGATQAVAHVGYVFDSEPAVSDVLPPASDVQPADRTAGPAQSASASAIAQPSTQSNSSLFDGISQPTSTSQPIASAQLAVQARSSSLFESFEQSQC